MSRNGQSRLLAAVFGYEAAQASMDRDDEARRNRPVTPSTSTTLARCATCGEWNRPGARTCRVCRVPFVAR